MEGGSGTVLGSVRSHAIEGVPPVKTFLCRSLITLIATLALAPICTAGVLLQTGFDSTEPPPFAAGPLLCQNGWFLLEGTPAPVVQTHTVFPSPHSFPPNATSLAAHTLFPPTFP